MPGVRSIGWWMPAGRRSAAELARDFRLGQDALAGVGLVETPVAGDDDHPSTMGARSTRAALDAAGLEVSDLDLLIFAGVTRDWPTPWVAAFGVLHELGSRRAAGFDLASRCAGGIDALWVARTLVEAGTYRNVAVCCAERFDHLMGPPRRLEVVTDAMYSAGAATAIVSRDCGNEILAFSSISNPDLSTHKSMGPIAGGTRRPLDRAALIEGLHQWRGQLSMRDAEEIARYSADADRHNYAALIRQTGFERIDFVACSPLHPEPQLQVLKELGVDEESTLFTVPRLGHVGPADLLLILGIATASGRRMGRRVVLSTRTPVYSNALALLGRGDDLGIAVGGEGVDVDLWRAASNPAGGSC